jgi:hypothetical protein
MAASSIGWGGVYFLSQILQELIYENPQRLLKDVNGNFYYASFILQSGNAALLNGTFYYNPDSRAITYVSQVNPGGNPVNANGVGVNPINGWVNSLGNASANGPALALPPPASGKLPQPVLPPSSNQGSPGLSGALTPYNPTNQQPNAGLAAQPLYTVYN